MPGDGPLAVDIRVRCWFEVPRAWVDLLMVWGDVGGLFLLVVPQLGISICLFSCCDRFPQKSLLYFPGHQLFGANFRGKNGLRFHSPLYKKSNLLGFLVNHNILNMRKLLKSLSVFVETLLGSYHVFHDLDLR